MERQYKLLWPLALIVPVVFAAIVFSPLVPVGQKRVPEATHTAGSLGAGLGDSSTDLADIFRRQAASFPASAKPAEGQTKALESEAPSRRRLESGVRLAEGDWRLRSWPETSRADIARRLSEIAGNGVSPVRGDVPATSYEKGADSARANISGTTQFPPPSTNAVVQPSYWAGSFFLVGGAPVHEWIAFQGFNTLPSGSAIKQEMSAYLPTDPNSAWYAEDFPLQLPHKTVSLVMYKPTAWSGCGVGPSATALIEGTFEEDEPSCYIGPDSSNSHYWNPDGGYTAGFKNASSALSDAQNRFASALANYPTNKAAAYYWLGRTAHLLADMSVPAHTLLDAHGFSDFDSYEDYTASGNNYKAINSSQWVMDPLQDPPSAYLTQGDARLTKLFYTLAKQSKAFDSDHVNGTSPVTGQGQFNAGGSISDYTLSVLHQPLLQSRAIGYSAALYTLFWERTHPPLSILLTGGNVVVSWPTNAIGFTLESTTNMPAARWASNSTPPAIVSGYYAVSNAISGGARFYRLKK